MINNIENPNVKIKKLTNSLKLSELKYKTLFHNMIDGWALHEIILNDAGEPIDYVFLDVNNPFETLTGLKRENIIGRRVKVVLPETEDYWIKRYGEVALNNTIDEFEEYSRDLNKTFRVRAFSPQKNQFVTIFVDITEQKKLDADRNQLLLQLQQSQKMEAIGTLAGGIAHDFNNILSAIIGYSELIKNDVDECSDVAHYIQQVFLASDRAKELIKRILSFSRQDVTNKSIIHPSIIINDAVQLLKASLPANISIKRIDCSEIGYIYADPIQIHQIIMNLCTNSYHAMEFSGGILIIALCNKNLSESDIPVGLNILPGNFLNISICGISPEIREKIFNPYFTTKPIGKGTGMGLSMVHNIVQNHGGFIRLDSAVNEGTTFTIALPVVENIKDDISEPIIDVVDDNIVPNYDKKILLVDDEDMLIQMGKLMLEKLGYHVTVKINSLDALKDFKNRPDYFDVIITDQNMPDMTGIDLSKHILEIRPNMPIILCTGYSSLVSKEVALSVGIKEFILKPFVRNDLINIIQRVSEKDN